MNGWQLGVSSHSLPARGFPHSCFQAMCRHLGARGVRSSTLGLICDLHPLLLLGSQQPLRSQPLSWSPDVHTHPGEGLSPKGFLPYKPGLPQPTKSQERQPTSDQVLGLLRCIFLPLLSLYLVSPTELAWPFHSLFSYSLRGLPFS